MEVRTGDVVAVAANAVYYTGKEIPGWVKKDQWIVKSVSGDRAVIDRNVSGSSSINSPVSTAYLTVVKQGQGASTASVAATNQKAAPAAQTSTAGNMMISEKGVELVARFEGCSLQAYRCPAGVWTIGYGHTANVGSKDTLPSVNAAKALLKEDLAKYAASVNNCVKKGMITFPLTQNQFDALTSFCYNCGAGSLQKLVSGRDAATVADKLLQYNKGGGKVLAGLTNRRKEERTLFLS